MIPFCIATTAEADPETDPFELASNKRYFRIQNIRNLDTDRAKYEGFIFKEKSAQTKT